MKIFISWSGERSKSIANALKQWLPDVFQGAQAWMSDHDINAGSRWGNELNMELESSNFGILCLTPENLNAPWILFEAGSLAKVVEVARVVPYRYQLKPTDVELPLAQFQGVDANEGGTFKLLESINEGFESKLSQDRLKRLFEKWWPDLNEQLSNIPVAPEDSKSQRSDRALFEEILELVRGQQRQLAVLNPVTLMGLSLSTEEMVNMSDEELQKHYSKLTRSYINADTQAGKYLISVEMRKTREELKQREAKRKNEAKEIETPEA